MNIIENLWGISNILCMFGALIFFSELEFCKEVWEKIQKQEQEDSQLAIRIIQKLLKYVLLSEYMSLETYFGSGN